MIFKSILGDRHMPLQGEQGQHEHHHNRLPFRPQGFFVPFCPLFLDLKSHLNLLLGRPRCAKSGSRAERKPGKKGILTFSNNSPKFKL